MNDLYNQLIGLIPRLPEVLFVLMVAIFGIPFVVMIISKTMRRLGTNAALTGFIKQLVRYGLWLLALLSILYSLGFTGLAATLSGSIVLMGVVLSQSVKELLTDVVAGFSLARDPDFEVGYTVEVGAGKVKGVVRRIGLRKVRVINEKGYTVVIPNSKVEVNEWIVYDRESKLKNTNRKT